MGLVESYELLKQKIVAIVPKNFSGDEFGNPPYLPPIFGSGFVVREDGLVITNKHVVELFFDLKSGNMIQEGKILFLTPKEEGVVMTAFDIEAVFVPGPLEVEGPYYGSKETDYAIIQAKVRGLSPVKLEKAYEFKEGKRVATAGYPMGENALMDSGQLVQITPTLQEGIISAVLPFPCSHPRAFASNIMSQGGASGSPIFDQESGNVIGILYGGLVEYGVIETTPAPANKYYRPTNITYAIPSYVLLFGVEKVEKSSNYSSYPVFDDLVKSKQKIDLNKETMFKKNNGNWSV